jgi:transposase
MSEQRFLTGSREQGFLLPPDMREWLPPDHLVWAICDAVDRLDFSRFEAEYRDDGQGRPAYDPRLMATLLLHAYSVGERSSRAIERRCREDVAFRVAACGLQPDHVTIARFRRRHAEALIGLFGGVLVLCAEAGLVRVGLVAIDGTGIRANANKDRVVDTSELAEEARRLLAEAEAADAREDALAEEEQTARRGLLPPGFANDQERRTRFDAAAQRLANAPPPAVEAPAAGDAQQRQQETAQGRGRALANTRRGKRNRTDPDSRILRTRAGFIQGYNAQVAVGESHLVLACAVSQDNGDNRLLEPMVSRTEQTLRAAGIAATPGVYLADGGYWSGAAVEELQAEGRRLLVKPNGRPRTRGLPASGPVAKMERRLARAPNKRRYRRRQALVEPVIAHLKHLRRLDRLLLRGIAGAELEWTLACTAHNLTRLARVPAGGA